MNTKIILSLGASALLASSLLALSPQQDRNQEDTPSCKQHKQMKQGDGSSCKQNKMMKHQKHGKKDSLVKMFMKLDLSDKQRSDIRAIVQESRKNRPNINAAFSDSSFNKAEFIKIAKLKRDNKIAHRAEVLEKIYAVLNTQQKKDLKTMLDMREIMKKNHNMPKKGQMK